MFSSLLHAALPQAADATGGAAAEAGGDDQRPTKPARRGPRRGFKHWTTAEDADLRGIVLDSLSRLRTLQAIAEECDSHFRRDDGSVLRRIRHLRQADPDFDAAVAARLGRAQPLAQENRGAEPAALRKAAEKMLSQREPRPTGSDPAPAAASAGHAGSAAAAVRGRAAPVAAESRTAGWGAGAAAGAGQDPIVQFLEDNSGPLTVGQRARAAELVQSHGQVRVMAALAHSLLNRADVILNDVEVRLGQR